MRLSATKALLERSDSIIVATVSAIYGLNDPEAYLEMVLHLVRGDVVDIFPAESERDAVRVQFFDEEIEALVHFDPLTGEVSGPCSILR